ncbi:MAG: UDP-N-acetylmuramoyl-tripeptide--D-alanyl-D-alanine ligase [Deltaproteobacteria bacterium]
MSAGFTAAQALAWTGGKPFGALPERFQGVSTDSRHVPAGSLFVALRGERFDGHAFVGAAARSGASAAMVAHGAALPEDARGLPRLEVEDTLRALGALALGHRRRFDLLVVGITGSVGKTSTKELTAAALSPRGAVLRTEGNLNNEIGVPLTLLELGPTHRTAVIEMGMNHEGEIARLAAIAEPRIGLVTNVRGVHLETLGTIERVASAKGELFRGLPDDGIAVVCADEPLALAQAHATGRRLVTYGRAAATATVLAKAPVDVRLEALLSSDWRGVRFRARAKEEVVEAQVAFLGEHNALNGCAALAVALAAEVPLDQAAAGLSQARPAPHRLAVILLPGDVVLLDDCYNANPHSVVAALETLRGIGGSARLGAILGDMLELGPDELRLHRETGAQTRGLAWVCAFGPRAAALAEGARAAGVPEVFQVVELDAAVERVGRTLRPGDRVLLKGSRGMRMERIAAALGAPAETGGH